MGVGDDATPPGKNLITVNDLVDQTNISIPRIFHIISVHINVIFKVIITFIGRNISCNVNILIKEIYQPTAVARTAQKYIKRNV